MTTNSCVVYAETCMRFPLCVFINMCMIKHRLKILNMNVKQLVHVAYREMLQYHGSDILKTCYVVMDLEISGTTSQ